MRAYSLKTPPLSGRKLGRLSDESDYIAVPEKGAVVGREVRYKGKKTKIKSKPSFFSRWFKDKFGRGEYRLAYILFNGWEE